MLIKAERKCALSVGRNILLSGRFVVLLILAAVVAFGFLPCKVYAAQPAGVNEVEATVDVSSNTVLWIIIVLLMVMLCLLAFLLISNKKLRKNMNKQRNEVIQYVIRNYKLLSEIKKLHHSFISRLWEIEQKQIRSIDNLRRAEDYTVRKQKYDTVHTEKYDTPPPASTSIEQKTDPIVEKQPVVVNEVVLVRTFNDLFLRTQEKSKVMDELCRELNIKKAKMIVRHEDTQFESALLEKSEGKYNVWAVKLASGKEYVIPDAGKGGISAALVNYCKLGAVFNIQGELATSKRSYDLLEAAEIVDKGNNLCGVIKKGKIIVK